jgi:hypothetical protein
VSDRIQAKEGMRTVNEPRKRETPDEVWDCLSNIGLTRHLTFEKSELRRQNLWRTVPTCTHLGEGHFAGTRNGGL